MLHFLLGLQDLSTGVGGKGYAPTESLEIKCLLKIKTRMITLELNLVWLTKQSTHWIFFLDEIFRSSRHVKFLNLVQNLKKIYFN